MCKIVDVQACAKQSIYRLQTCIYKLSISVDSISLFKESTINMGHDTIACIVPHHSGPTADDSPDRLDRFFGKLEPQKKVHVNRYWSCLFANSKLMVVNSYEGLTYVDKYNLKRFFQIGLFDHEMCQNGLVKILDARNNRFFLPALVWHFLESEREQLIRCDEWLRIYLKELQKEKQQNPGKEVVYPEDKEIVYRAALPLRAGHKFRIDITYNKKPREAREQEKSSDDKEGNSSNQSTSNDHTTNDPPEAFELLIRLQYVNTYNIFDENVIDNNQSYQLVTSLTGLCMFLDDQTPFLGPLIAGLDTCDDEIDPHDLPANYTDKAFAAQKRSLIDTRYPDNESFMDRICGSFISYNAY